MSSITKLNSSFQAPPVKTPERPKNWLLELLKSIFLSPFRACLGTHRKVVQIDVKPNLPYFDDKLIENERKATQERVVDIFTAQLENGTPWEIQLRKRKAAACKAMKDFNKKADQQYQFSEISFHYIEQLPWNSYQEICRNKGRLLNPHRRHSI
jgi:hypothetical protein